MWKVQNLMQKENGIGGQTMTLTNYKVIKTNFDNLEMLLNNLYLEFPQYHIYQILPEHSYDGALAVVILELDREEQDDYER